MNGQFGIILHGHLPFYGGNDLDNDVGNDLEGQRWLYECMAECYVPLLIKLDKLNKDKIDYGITLSFTTVLLYQLKSPRTRGKFIEYLIQQIQRAREDRESLNDEAKYKLADRYVKIYQEVLDYYNKINGDIIGELCRLKKENPRIQIGTSSLTHAYFPLYKIYSEKQVKIQIKTAIKLFTKWFSFEPEFFWIPEGGYYPGVDKILAKCGIKQTIIDPNGILISRRQPFNMHHFDSGIKIASINLMIQKMLWGDLSYSFGYHPIYRDFHAFEKKNKLKYWAISNNKDNKTVYDPELAKKVYPQQVNKVGMDLMKYFKVYPNYPEVLDPDNPFAVVLLDMEQWAHWWHEGLDFFEQLCRQFHNSPIKLSNISEISNKVKSTEIIINKACSWDINHEQWINSKTDQYNDALRELTQEIEPIIKDTESPVAKMIFIEYLLAGSSDWAFEISVARATRYGKYRLELHIQRLKYLINQYHKNKDVELKNIKNIDWLFEDISLKELIE